MRTAWVSCSVICSLGSCSKLLLLLGGFVLVVALEDLMCTRQRELAQSRVWLPRGMLAVARVPASLTCSWRRLEAFLRRFSSLMCCSTSRTALRVEMNMSPHRLTARLAFLSSDLVVCPPLYLSGSTQGHTGHDTHNDAGSADTRRAHVLDTVHRQRLHACPQLREMGSCARELALQVYHTFPLPHDGECCRTAAK